MGPRIEAWQREAAIGPIQWSGDLDDDCTAEWAGLMLRAEEMERGVWWWAVYDQASGEVLYDSYGELGAGKNGSDARHKAEGAARKWLVPPSR